jgi:hypothetical protein
MQRTHGIGVRIALNTLRQLLADAMIDQVSTSATNAKRKKMTEHVGLSKIDSLKNFPFFY